MARTSNFKECQKAEIFVRGRAHCSYTGIPLWILDGGADPCWPIDWADHIRPVSDGGLSEVSNGCCASYQANRKKGVGSMARLLIDGEPTCTLSRLNPTLQRSLLSGVKRFAALHESDWYFNRALSRTLFGVVWLYNVEGGYGAGKRGDKHYSQCAMKAIREWRNRSISIPSLELRGLTPPSPTPDQNLMLQLREATSASEVRAAMDHLLPVLSGSLGLLRTLLATERPAARRVATLELTRQPPWPPGVTSKLALISENENPSTVLQEVQ